MELGQRYWHSVSAGKLDQSLGPVRKPGCILSQDASRVGHCEMINKNNAIILGQSQRYVKPVYVRQSPTSSRESLSPCTQDKTPTVIGQLSSLTEASASYILMS
ncbi:hypothetical protein CBL_09366 [Carabus blaptoides fortunei]